MAMGLMELSRQLPQEALRQIAGAGVQRLRNVISSAHPLPLVPGCTLGLLGDPYRFVMKQCARLGSDAFQGRLLFRRTLFLMGEDAAVLFYNPQLFQRQGAAPLRLQRTLFGVGGLQALDGAEHRRRKALFMDLVASPEVVEQFSRLFGAALREAARDWPQQESVDFYGEVRLALTRSICAWAGLPLEEDEVEERCEQLSALFDQGRLFGPPHWRTWWRRRQAERWCRQALADLARGRRQAPQDSALHALLHYHDSSGQPLPPHEAAVELLNILRPVVAVSVYAVYVALALEAYPAYRERLRAEESFLPHFVQEVRRFYPFFPHAVARTRSAFEWNGLRFPAGTRVLLDLYGTNHDARAWTAPDVFHPERFQRRTPGAYALVPQGGGDAWMHHRCPGEALTLGLMAETARLLAREMEYRVVSDRGLQWSRLPPLPAEGLRLAGVRLAAGAALPPPARARGERSRGTH